MKPSDLPKLKNHIGKKGTQKLPDGRRKSYEIVGEIYVPQSGMPEKQFCPQKIKFEDNRFELRLSYYIIGKKERMRGKWTFGQFAPFIPVRDFKSIVKRAEKEGWI